MLYSSKVGLDVCFTKINFHFVQVLMGNLKIVFLKRAKFLILDSKKVLNSCMHRVRGVRLDLCFISPALGSKLHLSGKVAEHIP